MLSKAVVAAVVCAFALGAAGTAAAAIGPGEFTVFGSAAAQSLSSDQNQNGQPDPGDVLLIVGPLNIGGLQIGVWRAAVQFVNSSTLSVFGEFQFWGGALFVAGSFDPNAGPPTALSVVRSKGSFRGLTGRLAVADTGSGGNAFTFTLRCAAAEHDVRPPRPDHPGLCRSR
jgi:hypothetical protein